MSEALDIFISADPSSLIFVLYQIYSPTPSCPPKYILNGVTCLSSQQSGIKSSIPLGSAELRIEKEQINYIGDVYTYYTIL